MEGSLRRWGFWVFVLLLFPLALGALGLHPNRIESGASVEAPDVQPSRFLDRDYYREIDAYLNETIAVKGLGLAARAEIDYDLFGDAWFPLLAVGDNDFLFYRLLLDIPCPTLAAIEPPPIPADLATSGRSFVMLNMEKEYFYGDLLKSYDRPDPCVAIERAAVRQRLSELPNLIDADQALLTAATNPEDPVFFPYDSHWSPSGRMIVAESILEAVQPSLWDADSVVQREIRALQVYLRFLGRGDGTTIGSVVNRPGIEVTTLERTIDGDDLLLTGRTKASGNEVVAGRTLIIGDSQMSFLMPALEPYFEDLQFAYWDHITQTNVWPDATDIDRLIVQSVDRSAAGRFANPHLEAIIKQVGANNPD